MLDMGGKEPEVRVVTFLSNLDYIRLKRGKEGEDAIMRLLEKRDTHTISEK